MIMISCCMSQLLKILFSGCMDVWAMILIGVIHVGPVILAYW